MQDTRAPPYYKVKVHRSKANQRVGNFHRCSSIRMPLRQLSLNDRGHLIEMGAPTPAK